MFGTTWSQLFDMTKYIIEIICIFFNFYCRKIKSVYFKKRLIYSLKVLKKLWRQYELSKRWVNSKNPFFLFSNLLQQKRHIFKKTLRAFYTNIVQYLIINHWYFSCLSFSISLIFYSRLVIFFVQCFYNIYLRIVLKIYQRVLEFLFGVEPSVVIQGPSTRFD